MSKLIAVSGLDGCGKSSLADRIDGYLRDAGIEVKRSSAISLHSTPICRQIGDILRDPQTNDPLPPDAEHALMIAARSIAEVNVIAPALESGQWVVSDRYGLCGAAYQRGADGRFINYGVYKMRLTLFGLKREPDLEVILDIDPTRPHKPHEPDLNRLEDRPPEEWAEMREIYRRFGLTEPRAVFVDGHQSPDAVFGEVKPYIDKLISGEM